MNEYLAVSILGEDNPGMLSIISDYLFENECNIANSRMMLMGTAFAMILQLSGNWNNISKLEASLPAFAKKHKLTIKSHRCHDQQYEEQLITYTIDVITSSKLGIIAALSNFFTSQNINISEMACNSFAASLTKTPMIAMTFKIHIPSNIPLATLREEFITLCDELNLDAIMEPERNP